MAIIIIIMIISINKFEHFQYVFIKKKIKDIAVITRVANLYSLHCCSEKAPLDVVVPAGHWSQVVLPGRG